MNILVTGIHGFVGSNLVLSLKERHVLYGLDIVAPKKEGVTKTYSWDELEGVEGIDAIVHLAGKAHDTKNEAVAQTYFDINTGLTRKVFDYFLKSSAKKFIFFSSVKAAADFVVGDKLTEEVIPTPNGPYGESKIAAENYILEQLKIENGELKMCSILIFNFQLSIFNSLDVINRNTQALLHGYSQFVGIQTISFRGLGIDTNSQ